MPAGRSREAIGLATAFCLAFLLPGCATVEPRPAGVPRGVTFFVTPVYPSSFEIVAGGSRRFSAELLRDAWQKKAAEVASGRRFKSSSLVVRDTEFIPSGYGAAWPVQSRTVSGTMTLLE